MPHASGPSGNPVPLPRTIVEIVSSTGAIVGDDELVNFGSKPRPVVDPSRKYGFPVLSYWFQYRDIKHLTRAQLAVAIGAGTAFAGMPGGADAMRVSRLPARQFTRAPATSGTGIAEYVAVPPIPVRLNVDLS